MKRGFSGPDQKFIEAGCEYNCYGKQTGRRFQVYCKRMDKKCKPGAATLESPFLTHRNLPANLASSIAEIDWTGLTRFFPVVVPIWKGKEIEAAVAGMDLGVRFTLALLANNFDEDATPTVAEIAEKAGWKFRFSDTQRIADFFREIRKWVLAKLKEGSFF